MNRSVVKQIAELETLSREELKDRWRELLGIEPPAGSRSYWVKRLAYRIQELEFGGVSEATRGRLRAHLEKEGLSAEGTAPAPLERRNANDGGLTPGTRLVRTWRGQRYEVVVTDTGFEFDGRPYRSLTAVAKAITSQHWNGRAFFGLSKRRPN